MSDYKKRSKRIAVCLIEDAHCNILMGIRNDNGKWTTPGGHLEAGEDPYEGALRELEEETGLDAEHIQLVKVEYVKEKNMMLYLFKVTPNPRQMPDPSGDPDKEVEFWAYMDPNDTLGNLHVPPEHNIALKYWMKN